MNEVQVQASERGRCFVQVSVVDSTIDGSDRGPADDSLVELEVLEGGLDRLGDLGRLVGVVPQLGGDPDLVPGLSRLLLPPLDPVPNLGLNGRTRAR